MEERSGGRPFVEHPLSAELHLILPFALSPAFQGKAVCRSGGVVWFLPVRGISKGWGTRRQMVAFSLGTLGGFEPSSLGIAGLFGAQPVWEGGGLLSA